MDDNAILIKSKAFAIRTVKLYQYLTANKKEYILSKQILRSGTSIGANVKEAQYGQSKRDFVHKMRIALKEASETEYWLELLFETGYIESKHYDSLYKDCNEILRLLNSIVQSSSDGL